MQLIIFDEKESGYQEPITLRLIKELDGSIELVVVDRYGMAIPGGRLLTIRPTGKMRRCYGASYLFGFMCDKLGRIEEE